MKVMKITEFFKKHEKTISAVTGLGIFMLGLFTVLFYLYKRCRAEFNADFTDTILWANASVMSGHFYDPDYWYAYFLPFSGIPIMIPIVAAFGLTYFSHQLGMTVFVVIFAIALIIYMKTNECTWGGSLALSGLVMILMCASSITRMIFYGHIIHYSLAIVFMCIAYALYFKDRMIPLAIWCMLCCTNGMATFILFFVPFAGSIVLERYFDKTPISVEADRPLIKKLGIIFAGGFAGFMIKTVFFGSREYEDSITALLPSDGWVWKQSPFLLEWIKALTGSSGGDVMMMTFDGIRILVMYTLAIVLLVVPVFAAISYRKLKSRPLRLLILFYWLMFIMTMWTYSVSYASVSNWRLAGLVCAAIILSMLYTVNMLKEKLYIRWVIFLIPVFAVSTLVAMLTVKNIPSALNANENDQLIEIYKEHGLTRGYSSFWNTANAVTVLSDNTIQVSPILFWPDGRYGVRHYQSDPSGYVDVPGVDRYFVAVDGTEMGYVEDTLVPNAVETIKFDDGLYILVFDRNIFSDFTPVFSDPYPYE